MHKRHAFTLVEMLVVIAIIGIIAALVVNMNAGAQTAKRNAQVNAEKNKLMSMIENYQSKLNFFPPDNANLANTNNAGYTANYDGWAAINPLLFELTGATNNPPNNVGIIQVFQDFSGSNMIASSTLSNVCGRSAIANAYIDAPPQNFFQGGPKPAEYTNYPGNPPPIDGLVVPVIVNSAPNAPPNFWHYDASSPNRHKLNSYDLWAEYISATKSGSNIITTNGNW